MMDLQSLERTMVKISETPLRANQAFGCWKSTSDGCVPEPSVVGQKQTRG